MLEEIQKTNISSQFSKIRMSDKVKYRNLASNHSESESLIWINF